VDHGDLEAAHPLPGIGRDVVWSALVVALWMCVCGYVGVCVDVCVWGYVGMCVDVCVCVQVCEHVCYVCVCVVHVCACVCVCMYSCACCVNCRLQLVLTASLVLGLPVGGQFMASPINTCHVMTMLQMTV